MDSVAAKKSYELQAKVALNSEQMRNALEDVYSWQKEIKDKEKALIANNREPEENQQRANHETIPVRSKMYKNMKSGQEDDSAQDDEDAEKSEANANTETDNEKSEETKSTIIDSKVEARNKADELKDLGNKHVKLGEYKLAIIEYTTAIELVPSEPIYYSNRALCHLKLERYEECIKDCETALALDKLCIKAYYRRMQANEYLGNNMDALKDCTTVLAMEPKNSDARKSLQRINDRLKKNQKSQNSASFSPLRDDLIDIWPVDKPPYKRSNKALTRVEVVDVVGPKFSGAHNELKISDDDLEKLFNSNCGEFVEIKKLKESESDVDIKKHQSADLPTVDNAHIVKAEKKNTKIQPASESTAEPPTVKDQVKATESLSVEKKDTQKLTKPQKDLNNAAKLDDLSRKDNTEELKENEHLPPPPTTTSHFYVNWKELSPSKKYQYLKSVDLKLLPGILGAGFDSETLSDILRVLYNYYVPNNEEITAQTLLAITKNSQFTMLSWFLSIEDRKAVSGVINFLKESNNNTELVEKMEGLFSN